MKAATPDDVRTLCKRLLAAQPALAALPTRAIIDAVDAAAALLGREDEPERIQVLDSLVDVSGFSREMAVHALDRIREDWSAAALRRVVTSELGGDDVLDAFADRDGRLVRALGPKLSLHIFSGNVPGVGVTSIVRALLVRSAVLGKPAGREPALAGCFVRLLRRVHPEIGSAVAIAHWQGGDMELESAALAYADTVVHYGGADAVDDMRMRIPRGVRFIEHGPRVSFALVDGRLTEDPASLQRSARDMAQAVGSFDQQGCVSPQLCYVVGTRTHARTYSAAVAGELESLQQTLPRGRLEPGEAAAIREQRTRAEFGGAAEVWSGEDLQWTTILTDDPSFEGSCLNRTLLVKTARNWSMVIEAAAPFGHVLQTVGLDGFADEYPLIAGDLARIGAARICPIRDMPWPPPDWHHDGRGPLTELVRWVDLER